jgi:hypothetical protein
VRVRVRVRARARARARARVRARVRVIDARTPPNFHPTHTSHAGAMAHEALLAYDPAAADPPPLFFYLPWQNVHAPYEAPLAWEGDVLRGMLAATDAALGNIITALKTKQMWANTVVFYSADNGGTVRLCSLFSHCFVIFLFFGGRLVHVIHECSCLFRVEGGCVGPHPTVCASRGRLCWTAHHRLCALQAGLRPRCTVVCGRLHTNESVHGHFCRPAGRCWHAAGPPPYQAPLSGAGGAGARSPFAAVDVTARVRDRTAAQTGHCAVPNTPTGRVACGRRRLSAAE